MERLERIFEVLASTLWGDWLLLALIGVGVLYTVITDFIQIRRIPFILQQVLFRPRSPKLKDQGLSLSLSSIQAFFIGLSSIVGSGNIVGVSTAILSGGPGALFWMWVAAFVGMATKYGEIVLGICYRSTDQHGRLIGGPMYYISQGLKKPWLGMLVAILLLIQNTSGTLIQSNAIVNVTLANFGVPPLVTGCILAAIIGIIMVGGLKRTARVATRVCPFMAILYIGIGLVVICANFNQLPSVMASIFKGAFSLEAGVGGVMGHTMREAMRFGVARGLYSNEAGEGSAAVFHSSVLVDHPARQGVFGVMDVFFDTIVINSITGFVILSTGASVLHKNPATLTAAAFATVAPWMWYVATMSLMLFAATTLMSQWYFGHVSLLYISKEAAAKIYRICFPLMIVVGSLSGTDLVWLIQDCALGLLIIPNIVALVIMAPRVRRLTREFFSGITNTR